MRNLTKLIWAVVALAGALLVILLTLVLSPGSHKQPVATITLPGVHGTPKIKVVVPTDALAQAKATELGHHANLRSENPHGLSQAELDANLRQQEALAKTDQLPIITPDAAPQQRGCVTRLVQNYSSRRGVRPRVFILHYTVSPNRPGWSDVDSIVSLFNDAAFQASSNYVIDAEGHCAYIVRESDKAWTQAAFNPFAISVEVINTGNEPTYAGTAGLHKIALVVSDALKRWLLPVQRAIVSNCVVVRPGITDHKALGACGGGHSDIGRYSVDAVIQAVRNIRRQVKPLPLPTLCHVVAWKPHSLLRLLTRSPGKLVGLLRKQGYQRMSVACG